jgi:hypothetical protein
MLMMNDAACGFMRRPSFSRDVLVQRVQKL